jgi:hypothetical protein
VAIVTIIAFIDARRELWHGEIVYAPGQSPFHVRGSTYLGVREQADANIAGGMAALTAELPEGPHRAFAGQAFSPESWYDALPLRPITEVLAKLERRGWEDSVRARAEDAARRELGLLGRMRMLAGAPERAVERLQRFVSETFDFGEAELGELSAGQARLAVHRVPQPLGSLLLAMLQGRGNVLVGTAGGKQIKLGGRLVPTGQSGEIGLVDVRVELSWSK